MNKSPTPSQLQFLQHIYDRFRDMGRWPLVKALQVQFRREKSPQRMAQEIGRSHVICEQSGKDSVCYLTLRGVAACEGSDQDIDGFLAAIRSAARSFVETQERVSMTVAWLEAELGIDELSAERIFDLIWRDSGLMASGTTPHDGPRDLTLHDYVMYYEEVRTFDDFLATIERLKQDAMDTARLSAQQPPRTQLTANTARADGEWENISMPDPKRVFVVHGRDEALRRSIFAFLRAVNLEPLEWSQAVRLTGKGTPYIGEVLDDPV